MVYTIKAGCIECDSCLPQCPTGAIKSVPQVEGYWIDPTLCDGCADVERPRCVEVCSIGALTPLQAKKGRCKSTLLPAAIPDLFLNGRTNPFASSMVIWEACTILAQRGSLPWQADAQGRLFHSRAVHRGRGELKFRLAENPEAPIPTPMTLDQGTAALEFFDIRAACIHLIFAAYAVAADQPWQDSFFITDQHIEQYLGLDKRKDLTKLDKLTLIKDLVHQTCHLLVSLHWPRQGKVQAFTLAEHPVWQLQDTQYYVETDDQGCRHLIGLGFTLQAGDWARHFLNRQNYRRQTAFYQYGVLPQSLLVEVMSSWQQHEGAMRLLLWLLFKLRLGGDQRITIRTLLRIAYGEDRLVRAMTVRGAHKRLLKTFESDLETMHRYGIQPIFDPDTYPPDIQPLWARAAQIPDDANAALEFWTNDANRDLSLTDTAPRDKWQRLMNARLLGFELSADWQQTVRRTAPKRRRRQPQSQDDAQLKPLTGHAIKQARQRHQLTQRALAERLGKSQSWIRDVEKGRFGISRSDQSRLRQILELD